MYASFPIVGHLYKGQPKQANRAGADLKEKGLRFNSDLGHLNSAFAKAYGGVISESVRVYLPHETTEQNYHCCFSHDTLTGGTQMQCDGQRIFRKKERLEYPGQKGETCYTWRMQDADEPCKGLGQPKCPVCTPARKLIVMVEEFYQRGWQGQVIALNSRALNDIQLLHVLSQKEQWLRSLGGNLATIPSSVVSMPETDNRIRWILSRVPRTTFAPKSQKQGKTYQQTGDQQRVTSYLLHLEICPEWWEIAQERWGMGPYKIDPITKKAKPIRLVLMQEAMSQMQQIAQLAQQTGINPAQFLPQAMGHTAALPMAPEPMGQPLSTQQALPPAVAEALGEVALFKPKSDDPGNFRRLAAFGQSLGFAADKVGAFFTEEFPDRHTSELAEPHLQQMEDRIRLEWALQQSIHRSDDDSYEPLFLTLEEAQQALRGLDLPSDPRQRTEAWVNHIGQLVAGATTSIKT